MNVKKFRRFAKFLEIILMVLSILCAMSLMLVILALIFKRDNFNVIDFRLSFPIASSGGGDVPEKVHFLANCIAAIMGMLSYSYMFYKGSRFFKNLSKGDTPFSIENYKLLKYLGIFLIAVNIIIPILHSALITILMPKGYFIQIGFTSEFIIGLVIYAMAEVIQYGLTLQEFSDDAV